MMREESAAGFITSRVTLGGRPFGPEGPCPLGCSWTLAARGAGHELSGGGTRYGYETACLSTRIGAAFAALVLLVACSAPRPNESSYIETLVEDRAAKDEFFRSAVGCFSGAAPGAPCSPVPPERRAKMLPLSYYDADLSYRVPAALQVGGERPIFDIPTSIGTIRKMQKVGTLRFRLNGEPRTLSAFVEVPAQSTARLFVPFRDETSGIETYPAGRYLDLDRTASGVYDLDFNRAYHPNCYYDERYECPLPPLENRLKTAVRGGERLTDGYHASTAPGPEEPRPPSSP